MFNLFIGNGKRKSIIETVKSSIEYFITLICHERTKAIKFLFQINK